MVTVMMVIASTFIVCGLMVVVMCLERTLSDQPSDS